MARSADALQRRAQKRGRDLPEQQTADANAAAKDRASKKGTTEVSQALNEPGAWKCPSCGNHNFPSRYICHSKTCDEPKPEHAVRASQASRGGALGPKSWSSKPPSHKKPRRHDPETSKFVDWTKPQASAGQIQYNQVLRQRWKDGDPALVGEELERAQILVARDARKEQKKKEKPTKRERKQQRKANNDSSNNSNVDQTASVTANEEPSTKTEKEKPAKLSKKERQKAKQVLLQQLEDTKGTGMTEEALKRANECLNRKANRALVKKFQTTRGTGMSEDEKKRAQNLMARKERKHQRRVQERQQQQQQQEQNYAQ